MNISRAFYGVLTVSLLVVWARLTPHSANFSPVLALFLISGYLGKGQLYSFVLPLLALFGADIYLGLYPGWAFTYIPLILLIVVGALMKGRFLSMVASGLFGASLFFLISNFGVWIYSGLYSQDVDGLMKCYAMALPFFRFTLLGTFLGLGIFHLAGYLFKMRLIQTLLARK